MADLDQNVTDTGTDTGTAEATPTPLDAILDTPAADVPAREEAELGGGIDAPHVPLKALKRERERRQKADKQVEELRAELERFDNARLGFEESQVEERLAALDDSEADPVARYNQSFSNFGKNHGEQAVAKVDYALKRMTREQQQHVLYLTGNHADPVVAIQAYADQLGLLDFKGTPLEDALASKDKQQQPQDTSQLDRHVAELNRHGQEVAAAERRANFAACKADFVSEYGKAAYSEIDRLSIELAQSGHPVGQQFVQAVQTSPDPVGTAAQLLHQMGLWAAQNPQAQAPQQQMTFPSNLANRRNVGQRAGPGYAGPTPLNDIFRH